MSLIVTAEIRNQEDTTNTFAIVPLFVFVIIRRQRTPRLIMILCSASMIGFSKIDEGEGAAFSFYCFCCRASY